MAILRHFRSLLDRLRLRLCAFRSRHGGFLRRRRRGGGAASGDARQRVTVRDTATEAVGRWGEEQAVRLLESKGLAVTGRRVRFGRFELDIVALDRHGRRPEVVFVEVKTRSDEEHGPPRRSVNRRKRQALQHAAMLYLRRLGGDVPPFRIDVVEVIGNPGDSHPPVLRHHRNAVAMPARMTSGWSFRRK